MTAWRWLALAIAGAAIVDPRVTLPSRERPALRLVAGEDGAGVAERLRRAGFSTTASHERATVVTAGARLAPRVWPSPLYVLSPHPDAPDVRIVEASASPIRVPGQSVDVTATIRARGARGRPTAVQLEESGIAVAAGTHAWNGEDETWRVSLSYLPVTSEAARLRVRAGTSVADVLAPAARGPIRTLVYQSPVTWPTVFVRRALEADPAFDVASVLRATRGGAIRAGSPPATLSRGDLARFDVLVCGALDGFDAAARDAIRWFVEDRGGVLVFVPDRVPAQVPDLLRGFTFEPRVLDSPVTLKGSAGSVAAADLAVPRSASPFTTALAADPAGTPIVVAVRRGAGAIVVSGALDAWRYRDRDAASFARFWTASVVSQAVTVPARLEVTAEPAVARPGDVVRVRARLRETELPDGVERIGVPPARARVVDPAAHADAAVRLWPGPEPGVYEGEWRPDRAGHYTIDAAVGAATAAAIVQVTDAASTPVDERAWEIAAQGSGGGLFDEAAALVEALAARYPAETVARPAHPLRSPWAAVAFAACLCVEWGLRRRRGLP
jgi:hypothetical protein